MNTYSSCSNTGSRLLVLSCNAVCLQPAVSTELSLSLFSSMRHRHLHAWQPVMHMMHMMHTGPPALSFCAVQCTKVALCIEGLLQSYFMMQPVLTDAITKTAQQCQPANIAPIYTFRYHSGKSTPPPSFQVEKNSTNPLDKNFILQPLSPTCRPSKCQNEPPTARLVCGDHLSEPLINSSTASPFTCGKLLC